MLDNHRRWVLMTLIAIFSFLVLSSVTVFAAEPPKILVVPSWRPGTTLDTIDINGNGVNEFSDPNPANRDDFHYVDVDIYVTTTVQFWSVQLTCKTTPSALTSYNDFTQDGDNGNSIPPVVWGPTWGASNSDYTAVVDAFDTINGSRTITATKLGNTHPMGGVEGISEVILLATLRYRVKDVLKSTTATFSCVSSFLNRNGLPVLTASYTAPPALNVLTGYVASGTALYQGRTTHSGIEVNCTGPTAASNFTVVTSATGAWSQDTRAQGQYSCDFYGNITNTAAGYQPDRYLAARTIFNISGLSYNVLPITLGGGNTVITNANVNAPDELVNINDLNIITAPANWNKTSTAGDINGDGKTNQADLAILGTNFNSSEVVDSRHGIYSVARYSDEQSWQLNRIWVGKMDAGGVQQLVTNNVLDSRDLWPTMSPDGKQIAFVRDVGAGSGTSTALYIAPVVAGVVGTPVRLTPPNAWYQAFAPSWSPDGTRIAFICSWLDTGQGSVDGAAKGHLANIGDVCIIDVTGRNWRDLTPNASKSRIYPPAWLSDTHIVYGGSSSSIGFATNMNTTCPDTLCYINVLNGDSAKFNTGIGAAGTLQDMPVVRSNILFYRQINTAGTPEDTSDDTRSLRWAVLKRGSWDGTITGLVNLISPFNTATAGNFHLPVEYDSDAGAPVVLAPLSNNVDYYNVSSTGFNVVFYTPGGTSFRKSLIVSGDGNATRLLWTDSALRVSSVNDTFANPFNPAHTPYDTSDVDDGDWVYGYRNTIDWVP